MTDKFVLTKYMDVELIGLDTGNGIQVLGDKEIVGILNNLNNTCILLEERIAG